MMNSFSEAKIKQIALLIFILLIGFLFRFINLKGDASAGDISRSGVFYVDEGTYAHNVVNKALFGEWLLQDDYNAMSNVPVFSLFQYAVVKLLGVGLAPVRCGAIFYSLLALLLLWLILKSVDPDVAIFALILGAVNYFFIIYNRLALLENLLVLFLVIITGLLFVYHNKQKPIWLILATIFWVAGYFVKATVIFFLSVILITIYLANSSWKKRIIHLSIFIATLILLAIGCYYLWILPHKADWLYFQQLNIALKIPGSPIQILSNYARYFGNLKLFPFMPVLYTIFLFYIGYLFINLFKRKKISFPEILFMTWAASGILFLGFFEYSPPRFSLVLMPAIISLAAIFFSKVRQNTFQLLQKELLIIIGFVTILCCFQIMFGVYRIIRDHHHYLSCYLPWFSLPAIGLLYWTHKNLLLKKYNYWLLTSIIIISLIQVGYYHLTIKFSYYNAIKNMKFQMDQYPEEPKILVGDIAPLVATELKIKAVNIIFRPETEKNRFVQQRPTFLILQDRIQLDRLKQKMPDYLYDVHLLKSYRIFDNYVYNDNTHLFKIEISHLQ